MNGCVIGRYLQIEPKFMFVLKLKILSEKGFKAIKKLALEIVFIHSTWRRTP
jgi:hypothetical protein